ncbi:tRNA-dihydrouridine synthase A [Micractinium conductrix]|uniref:tRNA-dihydrouridine synthase A n=1 Tax=Micractinium conductrix TaxID=554055 RepID=A0A2P6VDU0_9CHLO|nr:tRNA-dihydrouridine synthase A [Micractinium conductrix]|eukprot:PSC72239.1 tRNA-dihydrouridine synthase A [Micractinium conductrix]
MTVPQAASPVEVKPQLLSVAPMMDWTDLYYRQLARLISRHTWLYTEMVVDQTIIHTPYLDKFLWFPPEQRPIVCQLGGSDPQLLARAAAIVQRYGYDEINLNCGCPSDRVAGAGCFGAAMMLRPELVAACCKAMAEAVSTPITVKCRLGVDSFDSYPELARFIAAVASGSPVRHFIIHARKCLLKGLNPHQNRTVPPLRYEWVWALKRDFPHLDFSLNGGVLTLEEVATGLRTFNDSSSSGGGGCKARAAAVGAAEAAAGAAAEASAEGVAAAAAAAAGGSASAGGAAAGGEQRQGILGVMVGRAAYNMPWDALADADRAVFGAATNAATSRRQVLADYAAWADGMIGHWRVEADGFKSPNVRTLVKPLLGMFHGEPRAKKWRAAVDTALKTAESVSEVLEMTLPVLQPESLDAPPRPLGELPQRLEHFALELPPTPEATALRCADAPSGSSEAAAADMVAAA